jgi:hypothetical protein
MRKKEIKIKADQVDPSGILHSVPQGVPVTLRHMPPERHSYKMLELFMEIWHPPVGGVDAAFDLSRPDALKETVKAYHPDTNLPRDMITGMRPDSRKDDSSNPEITNSCAGSTAAVSELKCRSKNHRTITY